MDLSLSGQTSIFGGVFFVFKSLLGIERQKKLKTRRIFAFTRALCLGETLVLLNVVSQHMAYIVT